jgi:KaiC/GvpD/RAD55 family RecA-like ATPase
MHISTIVDSLDASIKNDFFRGNIILVAGRTGSYKTILSTRFTHNFAIHGNVGDGRRR